VALGLGGHAIAAGDFANFDAAAVGHVGGDEFIEQLADDGAGFAVALAGHAAGFGFSVFRSWRRGFRGGGRSGPAAGSAI